MTQLLSDDEVGLSTGRPTLVSDDEVGLGGQINPDNYGRIAAVRIEKARRKAQVAGSDLNQNQQAAIMDSYRMMAGMEPLSLGDTFAESQRYTAQHQGEILNLARSTASAFERQAVNLVAPAVDLISPGWGESVRKDIAVMNPFDPDRISGKAGGIVAKLPLLLAGGGAKAAAGIFGLDAMTESLATSEDTGIEGAKKWGAAAGEGALTAGSILLGGKLSQWATKSLASKIPRLRYLLSTGAGETAGKIITKEALRAGITIPTFGSSMLLGQISKNLIAQKTTDPKRKWNDGLEETALQVAAVTLSVHIARAAKGAVTAKPVIAPFRGKPGQGLLPPPTEPTARPAPKPVAGAIVPAGDKVVPGIKLGLGKIVKYKEPQIITTTYPPGPSGGGTHIDADKNIIFVEKGTKDVDREIAHEKGVLIGLRLGDDAFWKAWAKASYHPDMFIELESAAERSGTWRPTAVNPFASDKLGGEIALWRVGKPVDPSVKTVFDQFLGGKGLVEEKIIRDQESQAIVPAGKHPRKMTRGEIKTDLTANPDRYVYHTSPFGIEITKDGLQAGGLAGGYPEGREYGDYVHVFLQEDIPPEIDKAGNDVSFTDLSKLKKPLIPIETFTADEMGLEYNYDSPRFQEIGGEIEPPMPGDEAPAPPPVGPPPVGPPGEPQVGGMGEQGAVSLAATSNALGRMVRGIVQGFNFVTGEMAASVSDTAGGSYLVRVLDEVSNKKASLVGPIENQATEARKTFPRAQRQWASGWDDKGYGNFQRLQEDTPSGRLDVPDAGTQAMVDAYQNMVDATGLEAERVGMQAIAPDGKVIDFKRARDGRYLRTFTPEAYRSIQRGSGPLFDAIAKAISRDNDVDVGGAKEFLREWLGPESIRKIGQLEKLRVIKNLPVAVDLNGTWVAIQETDPYQAIISHAKRQAQRIYMAEALGQGLKGEPTLADRLRAEHEASGGNVDAFDDMLTVFEGRRLGKPRIFHDPRNPLVRAAKFADTLVASSMTSLSAVPNIPQTFILLPKYVGWANYGKAIAEVLRHPYMTVDQLTAIGAMNHAIVDYTLRPGHGPEDLANIFRGTVARYTGLEAMSQFNNAVAGAGFRSLADSWRQNGIDDKGIAVARDLRLTKVEIKAIQKGEMTEAIYNKIIQNGVKITEYITEDPHRMSKFQKIPMLNAIFAFNNYAIGTFKSVARTVREAATAAASGNTRQRVAAAQRLVYLLVGLAGAGTITTLLRRAAKGQEVFREDESALELIMGGLWESAILGPTQRMQDAFTYGGSTKEAVIGLSPKIAAAVKLLEAVRGDGTWGEMPPEKRAGKFITGLSPLARGAENWWDRLKYPQTEIYKRVRSMVGVYRKEELKVEKAKVRGAPINPHYYGVHQAILMDEPEAMQKALEQYNEWTVEQGWDDEEARKRLRLALSSRRPVNFSFADYREFLASVPDEKKHMVRTAQAHYQEAMDQVTLTEAERNVGDVLLESRIRGDISKSEFRRIRRESRKSPLVKKLTGLSAADALRVWKTATADEREEIRPVLRRKLRGFRKQETKKKHSALAAQYRIAGVIE